MRRVFSAVAILLVANGQINAGTASAGMVSSVHLMQDGMAIFYTDGARAGVPTCASNYPSRVAFDGTSAAGKNQLAGVLSAQASGRQIVVVGTGSCSLRSDTESVQYLYVI